MAGQSLLKRILGDVGLYGAVALYVAFALLPIFWTVKISVTPQNLLYSEGIRFWPSRTTLANYHEVLSASDFPRYFLNSVIVSLSTAIIVTAIASFAGYALSRFRFNGKTGVSFLLLMTQTFPLVMVIPPIYRIMGSIGLTDNLYGLIVIYTAFNIAFATFLMQSFFDDVPRDLEEAAMIDGCTRLLALRKIIVPLTLPGMGATLAFVFTAACPGFPARCGGMSASSSSGRVSTRISPRKRTFASTPCCTACIPTHRRTCSCNGHTANR